MLTFRCTVAMQRKLHIYPAADAPSSTTLLGDWYAHIVNAGHTRLVLCVSEVSRLVVILAARNFDAFVPRFQSASREVLEEIGVGSSAIEKELAEMNDVGFARTKNRSVLGTINDFSHHLRWLAKDRPDFSLVDCALYLSQIPVGPYPDYKIPAHLTRQLFGAAVVRPFPSRE